MRIGIEGVPGGRRRFALVDAQTTGLGPTFEYLSPIRSTMG